MGNSSKKQDLCDHKFNIKEIDRVRQEYGRSNSRCETWIQSDVYFCEKCLFEKEVKKQWCGQEHYSDVLTGLKEAFLEEKYFGSQ